LKKINIQSKAKVKKIIKKNFFDLLFERKVKIKVYINLKKNLLIPEISSIISIKIFLTLTKFSKACTEIFHMRNETDQAIEKLYKFEININDSIQYEIISLGIKTRYITKIIAVRICKIHKVNNM
jgi:hypothetical protein